MVNYHYLAENRVIAQYFSSMTHAVAIKGGGLSIYKQSLTRSGRICLGRAYIPDAVTNEPKIHGVIKEGDLPPTGGRGDHRRGTRCIPTWMKDM